MKYYISDLHFGHKNILRYDNRPFQTTDEMDEALIALWNETITNADDVYILGDVSWLSVPDTIKIFSQLKGIKHLIVGNHDGKYIKDQNFVNLFVEVVEYKEIYDNDTLVVLSHYPIIFFKNQHHGAVHFYGHVHNSQDWNFVESAKTSIKELYADENCCKMYNVGCMMDYINYIPRTFKEIVK